MHLGFDLDNTIACYDGLFHQVAVADGLLDAAAPQDKTWIRDHLRSRGLEQNWTELQGRVYGPEMRLAKPFPGVIEFLRAALDRGCQISIISHRTCRPFAGPPFDLHAAARAWLQESVLLPVGSALSIEDVFLEDTREAKMDRIASQRCISFVDDLPEFLCDPAFPKRVRRIWFAPNSTSRSHEELTCIKQWRELHELLLDADGALDDGNASEEGSP